MKLRCKPEQPDLADAQHKESDGEVDQGAGSEDEGKRKEINKEDGVLQIKIMVKMVTKLVLTQELLPDKEAKWVLLVLLLVH